LALSSCASARCPTRRVDDADVCDVGGLRLSCLPLPWFDFVTERWYDGF
jgi:hypothetical protein